jgi:hypothetical protein
MKRFNPPGTYHELFPASEKPSLIAVQKQLNRTLPDDYLDFLSQWNGLAFQDELLVPLESVDEDEFPFLSYLFGLSAKKSLLDVRNSGESYHFNSRVPDGLLAIGEICRGTFSQCHFVTVILEQHISGCPARAGPAKKNQLLPNIYSKLHRALLKCGT